MEQIALELARLNKTMAEILHLIQKEMKKSEELNYKFSNDKPYKEDTITVALCEEQIRDWASELAQQEIEKRPEGKKLSQLKQVKRVALDTIMEAHAPADLIANLDKVLQASIGISWNNTAPQLSNA